MKFRASGGIFSPQPFSAGFILSLASFCVILCCSFVMTFFRVFTVTAIVVQKVSVGPIVVPNTGVGWSCTLISVEIGEGGSGFRNVLQCFDKLKLARSER